MLSASFKDLEPLPVHVADYPDGEARTREGLPVDDVFGYAELPPDDPHLVLEKFPERLYQFHFHSFGQSAHIMMALYRSGRPFRGHALDDVGIERALREKPGRAVLARPLPRIS